MLADLNVVCAGNVDAGKSTLLGVLLLGRADDGRGSARQAVFNFPHEQSTGRTSSVAQHILGFDEKGSVTNYHHLNKHGLNWEEIVTNSKKVVTFFDLCGHEKYLKTTILGFTSQFPDLALILIGSNMGISKMTKEHIFLCLALNIPFVIVFTKTDICRDRGDILAQTVRDAKQLLRHPPVNKIPIDIRTSNDMSLLSAANSVPCFYVSSVTEEGLDLLRTFLFQYNHKSARFNNDNRVEYHISQIFHVMGVGLVLGGQLVRGTISVGEKLLLGPGNGQYHPVTVRGLHCKRRIIDTAQPGQYITIAIKNPDDVHIRRGQVLIAPQDKPVMVSQFRAEIVVMKSNATTIKVGYEPVVHTCSVRQTAKIVTINDSVEPTTVLRTGDRAVVNFRFAYRPEYIQPGYKILLAEGRIKIIGRIIAVTNDE